MKPSANAGKILLVGGAGPYKDHRFVVLASAELYDPVANAFAPGPAMHGTPEMAVAVQLPPAPPPQ